MRFNWFLPAIGGMAFAVFVSASLAPSAQAQWYVSGNAGANFVNDADITDTVTGGSLTGETSFDTGFALSGAIGRAFGNFRIEGEISYRQNDLDELQVDSVVLAGTTLSGVTGTFPLEGDVSSLGFMANGWYDVPTGGNWVPFVGAGLGFARLSIDIESVGGIATTFDETETVFAYQAAAGIGYKVAPGTTVTLSYRLFGTSDPDFESGTETIESEYLSHSILAGFIHRF